MKDFNFDDFSSWKQDTQDYSDVFTKEKYVARLGQDIIKYCIAELGTSHHDAYYLSDKYFQLECHRLGIKLQA